MTLVAVYAFGLSSILCVGALSPSMSSAQKVISETHRDVSAPLSDRRDSTEVVTQHQEMRKHPPLPNPFGSGKQDPLGPGMRMASGIATTTGAPTPGVTFEGIGQGFTGPAGTFSVSSAPPDTNGTVGPNHYVETVNTSFAVFSKAGTPLYGPVNINTIWSGFGGGCQTNNDGDPTVVYDKIADRWIIQQFSVSTTPYLLCVAVSTTGNPMGSYNRYSFQYANFPDYPKLSIWPDAFYVTTNDFQGGSTFVGASTCAMDRTKMLAGQAASLVCFNSGSNYGGLLSSDFDGKTLPPAGSPNYVMALDTSSSLVYWKFHVDFATPANSTFTGPTSIAVAGYTQTCSATGTCVPQLGTTQKLDSLADRLMYRLAYRNFGTHEALVVNHSVVAGTSSGVRWYELRIASGTPSLFQQGTYAPDANWRWMGSVAMDQAGNMGLGYSVSGGGISPQIHYTGRLAGDALGTMTQGENSIINGTGSQTGNNLSRWGDYSSMSVDPSDDCTFWYTNEYLKTSGSFNWNTRVGSFKMPGCGQVQTADFALSASPASQTVVRGQGTTYNVAVAPLNGFTGAVNFSVSGMPAGVTASFNPTSVTTSGSTAMAVATTAATAPGTYTLSITGTGTSATHTTTVTLVVTQAPDFAVSASPSSQTVVQGQGKSYTVTVTPSNGFTGAVTLSASGLPAGVTASFSPASLTTSGNSTMTVATTAATVPGTYTLTITGTGTSATHSATVTLVVTNQAPNFTLVASPASQTVLKGSSKLYTVTISPLNGFTGAVTFSASALPAGVTASFSPASVTTSGSSTMTVATTIATVPGTYTLTIMGTGASVTHTTTVTLVVTKRH